MPRNMSFSLTTPQIRHRSKTVTRRNGWFFLKPGDVLNACVKCMGLQKGEKIEKICKIKVKKTQTQRLDQISYADCVKEGFPELKPSEFIDMYCSHNACSPQTEINRIEFEYL